MGNTKDQLRLSETEFVTIINNCDNKQDFRNIKNILEYGDDALYSWDSVEHCLLVLFTKTLLTKEIKVVQRLYPSLTILTEVKKLCLNLSGTKIAVVCKADVYVIELPGRGGMSSAFLGCGKDITCRARKLFSRLHQYEKMPIRQVRWHPNPAKDNCLSVLTFANHIELWDVVSCEITDILHLHKKSYKRVPSSHSMGESVVDFCYIPQSSWKYFKQTYKITNTSEILNWPALILEGNGNIYIIDVDIKYSGRYYALVSPPLLMYPPTVDNYDFEYSGLLVLDATVPVVVIASTHGIIYQGFILDQPASYENGDNNANNGDECDNVLALHMYQYIELDIGYNSGVNYNSTADEMILSPIKLVKDLSNRTRYFAIHAAGVYSITLPFINDLNFIFTDKCKDDCLEFAEFFESAKNKCIVEYLVCTQIDGSHPTPILGFACIDNPVPSIIVLFPNRIISLQLKAWLVPSSKHMENDQQETSTENEFHGPDFQEQVLRILQANASGMPIFQVGRVRLSLLQKLEILARTTKYFREVELPKQITASQMIRSKVQLLKKMKERQIEEINYLGLSRKKCKEQVPLIAEKFKEANEKKNELLLRVKKLLLLTKLRCRNGLSVSEKQMAEKLKHFEQNINELKSSFDCLKSNQDACEKAADINREDFKNAISQKDHKLFLGCLSDMNSDISVVKNKLERVKNAVSKIN